MLQPVDSVKNPVSKRPLLPDNGDRYEIIANDELTSPLLPGFTCAIAQIFA